MSPTIAELERQVAEARATYERLYALLQRKQAEVAATCPHDVFSAEDDGDCHSSGWYYTCQECRLMTRVKPAGKKIVYYK